MRRRDPRAALRVAVSALALVGALALGGCGAGATSAQALTDYLAQVEPLRLAVNSLLGKADPILSVPGSFEIPVAAQALADAGNVDAVICLGCVIKGETAHFEHVAEAAAKGILDVALETGVPCIFGVLTTYTEAQATTRKDRGREAAETAIEMANLLRQVRKG